MPGIQQALVFKIFTGIVLSHNAQNRLMDTLTVVFLMLQWLANFSIKNILFKNYSRYLKHTIGMHVSILRQKYDIRTCYALQYSLLYYHIVFRNSCLFRSIIPLFRIQPFPESQ